MKNFKILYGRVAASWGSFYDCLAYKYAYVSRRVKACQFTFRPNGLGGLVVSMLASGTQVCGFKPGRSRWIFTGVKILNMPSSGGEVKESVPCPSFAACKRT